MGYCYFGRCECSLLMDNGFCVNDTIDKCIHPAAVEDYKNAYKYIEHEPPKPNPDLVVVTRCKDCKYWELYTKSLGYCKDMHGFGFCRWWGPDDFCSRGERKDGDENAVN